MNLKLLLVLTVLSLTACATPRVHDASPASDLDVLVANVRKNASKVLLPNGKEYCVELVKTNDELDDCATDLEDALFNANRRGESQIETVEKFVNRERLRRNPCGFWKRTFQSAKCK